MAFSFRAGTNWCHDFPKLARESGFYFNTHTARVRVDWNRIASIDIERVIRERDYQTVDDNVNNVIDYYLEHEYDLKILDPNFVKLFRLAQLAVEYLLYCKQYLDQSVVILKDEMKFKIEENERLKGNVLSLENLVRELKHQLKERSKTETKIDPHGEIHRCSQCPKTFVSAAFAKAHVVRRHSNLTETIPVSTPVHEEYRAETEKLHNEIKSLKERINQTERVIRNESKSYENNAFEERRDDQYRKYQEEINNLKVIFFNELKNLKQHDLVERSSEVSEDTIKKIVDEQEIEIEKLKNQLHENMKTKTTDDENRFKKQEEYWRTKLGELESQHQKDIKNLFSQLKLTQESANNMKVEYEEKIVNLEKQTKNQRQILNVQNEKINSLTKGIYSKYGNESSKKKPKPKDNNSDSESCEDLRQMTAKLKQKKNEFFKESDSNSSSENVSPTVKTQTFVDPKKNEKLIKPKSVSESSNVSETNVESESTYSESESSHSSESKSEEQVVDRNPKTQVLKKNLTRKELQKIFENRLRDLGIDPDWKGIPAATYKEKTEILKHQQNIIAKKFGKYHHVRKKLIEDISKKVFSKNKGLTIFEPSTPSFLNKTVKSVKTKALKAFTDFKELRGTSTPVLDSRNSSPEKKPRRKFSLEILPKKPTQFDVESIKKQAEVETVTKKDDKLSTASSDSETSVSSESENKIPETKAPNLQERSYQSIEEFMRDIDEISKPETMKIQKKESSISVFSPKKESDDTFITLQSPKISKSEPSISNVLSPKGSKSVLKSTTGPSTSAVKKKVLFDLDEKDDTRDPEKKEVAFDWNVERMSSLMNINSNQSSQKEDIPVKTLQSDKISEISRQIQEQLEATRRRPAGSIEAMFAPKSSKPEIKTTLDYILENTSNEVPRAAPRLTQGRPRTATKHSELSIEDLLAR